MTSPLRGNLATSRPLPDLKKPLIILDLNGTILERGPRPSFSIRPSFQVHSQPVYLRPHLAELLAFLFEHFRVGIWTSWKARNAYWTVFRAFGRNLDVRETLLDHPDDKFEVHLDSGAVKEKLVQLQYELGALRRYTKKLETTLGISSRMDQDNHVKSEQKDMAMLRRKLERLEEEHLRLNVLHTFQKEWENELESSVELIPRYPLTFLWTQRRCLWRNQSPSEEWMKPCKPVAIKDLAQLFSSASDSSMFPSDHDTTGLYYYQPDFPDLNFALACPSQCLLVDDSPYKVAFQPNNALILPTFSVEHPEEASHDRELLKLKTYLEKYRLAYEAGPEASDIRDFLKDHPY